MSPYRTTRRVEFRDTDSAGIAHFSVYFTFMEEAEHELLRHVGLSVIDHSGHETISWPRVSAQCDYRGAVKFEDIVDIEVRIVRLGEKSITYGFHLTHAGRPVAEGKLTAVCCRLPKNAPPESIAIPSFIREHLTPYVEGQSDEAAN